LLQKKINIKTLLIIFIKKGLIKLKVKQKRSIAVAVIFHEHVHFNQSVSDLVKYLGKEKEKPELFCNPIAISRYTDKAKNKRVICVASHNLREKSKVGTANTRHRHYSTYGASFLGGKYVPKF